MAIKWSARRNILHWLSAEETAWWGRLEEDQFLSRIFDLEDLPSHDYRFHAATRNTWQHPVNNQDSPDDRVFNDSRFNLRGCSDETFLQFLAVCAWTMPPCRIRHTSRPPIG